MMPSGINTLKVSVYEVHDSISIKHRSLGHRRVYTYGEEPLVVATQKVTVAKLSQLSQFINVHSVTSRSFSFTMFVQKYTEGFLRSIVAFHLSFDRFSVNLCT